MNTLVNYYALTNESILLLVVSVIVLVDCIGCFHGYVLCRVNYSTWCDPLPVSRHV